MFPFSSKLPIFCKSNILADASSIGNQLLITRKISNLFIFFYEKILNAQKQLQANINQQNKNKRTKKQQR